MWPVRDNPEDEQAISVFGTIDIFSFFSFFFQMIFTFVPGSTGRFMNAKSNV